MQPVRGDLGELSSLQEDVENLGSFTGMSRDYNCTYDILMEVLDSNM